MDFVDNLDRFLDDVGEDMILRRTVSNSKVSVTIRGFKKIVRRPEHLGSGMAQDDIQVVSSMTPIRAANWPGAQVSGANGSAPFQVDPAIPARDDDIIIQGNRFRIEAVDAKSIKGTVFRLVMLVKGNASGA